MQLEQDREGTAKCWRLLGSSACSEASPRIHLPAGVQLAGTHPERFPQVPKPAGPRAALAGRCSPPAALPATLQLCSSCVPATGATRLPTPPTAAACIHRSLCHAAAPTASPATCVCAHHGLLYLCTEVFFLNKTSEQRLCCMVIFFRLQQHVPVLLSFSRRLARQLCMAVVLLRMPNRDLMQTSL